MSLENRPQFLLAGDVDDLPAIRGMIARLPVDAYGQVYLEVDGADQEQYWPVIGDLSVTWLFRDIASSSLGGVPPRGELVARAVMAWTEEWMPEEPRDGAPCVLWIGCSASEHVDALYRRLSARLGPAALRHPHHDH